MRQKQLFLDRSFRLKKEFGGSMLKNSNAKSARPISTKDAMHVVLRSSMAKGRFSMLNQNNSQTIGKILATQAKKFRIKIYRFANVGNHLHLLVRASDRNEFKSFLRALTGLVARTILGAERGAAKLVKFWDQRPWSRIVTWGKDFVGAGKYVHQNFNEAMGFIAYAPRNARKLRKVARLRKSPS